MTTNQSAIIIREAAKGAGLESSRVHNPRDDNFAGVEARNHAIRLAYAQGVHPEALQKKYARLRK